MKKDYQEFNIKLNMKTILLFEQLSDKSFYNIEHEDMALLTYCSLIVNNNINITFEKFQKILTNQKIAKVLYKKCQDEFDFITQFNKQVKPTEKTDVPSSSFEKLTDVVNILILNYGIDINYIMYDMRLWELPKLLKSIDEKTKGDMVEKRFWAYLNICPHIDGKKIKGPESLLPFPWEKEDKKKETLRFMEENKDAIKAVFNKKKKDVDHE